MIFLLDFGTVPTVWHFLFFLFPKSNRKIIETKLK
jgi:hypothetical protein